MDHFLPSHQNFTQNSARYSKIGVLQILAKKYAHFRASKSILEFNVSTLGYLACLKDSKKPPHMDAPES